MVWVSRCLENIFKNHDQLNESMNQLINYRGVFRTAPATPGLLITEQFFINQPGVARNVLFKELQTNLKYTLCNFLKAQVSDA